MKKIIVLLILLVSTCGCNLFKHDSMENISIITTNYSLEYVTNYLYGDNSYITSIYPNGINIDDYTFTSKQIKDFSKQDLFIYMGTTDDSNMAVTLLNKNKNIKIIDATYGMEYKNKQDELWLNSSNLLMIAQNIKNGLSEYITSTYLLKDIENRYLELKVNLSSLDAEYKTTIENANYDTIIVNSDNLLFLEKYNLKVISLDKNNENYEKNLALFRSNIRNGNVKYFYNYEGVQNNEDIQKIIEENQIEILTIRNLKNITDKERDNKKDYLSIMYDNLENLKQELYKNS